MASKKQLEKCIIEFLRKSEKEFQFPELWDYVYEKLKEKKLTDNDKEKVMRLLENELDNLVVSRTEPIPNNKHYELQFFIARKNIFNGTEFLIRLSEVEIENGILIAGHRFTPYCTANIKSSDVKLKEKDTEKFFPKKKHQIVYDKLIVFYTILGINYMNHELAEYEENTSSLLKLEINDKLVTMNVFDMKEFYSKNKCKSGDYLLCKVLDFEEAVCECCYVSNETLSKDFGKVKDWCRKFEKSLIKIVKSYKERTYDLDSPKQLSEAFYISDSSMLKNPPVHLGGFLNYSNKIELVNVDKDTLLWQKGIKFVQPGLAMLNNKLDEFGENDFFDEIGITEDMIQEAIGEKISKEEINNLKNLFLDKVHGSSKKLNSLDNVLEYMGYNFDKHEVEAYMRDELFSGTKELKNVMKRCYDDRDAVYPDAAPKLYEYTEKLWEKVSRDYNFFADKRVGDMRGEFLMLNDQNLAWQRKIDSSRGLLSLKDIPEELLNILIELLPQINSFVVSLNSPVKMKDKEIKEMKALMQEVSPLINMTMTHLNQILDDTLEKRKNKKTKLMKK